jgi:ATP-dependent Lon protease
MIRETEQISFLPVLPLKNVVTLPRSIVPVIVGRDISIKAVEYALEHGKEIFVTAQKSFDTQSPLSKDVFHYGTRAVILQASHLSNGTLKILIEGVARVRILEVKHEEPFIGVTYETLTVQPLDKKPENLALNRTLYDLFKTYVELGDKISKDVLSVFNDLDDLDYLADTVAVHVQLKLDERQQILEMLDLKARVKKLIVILKNEIEILKTEQRIRSRVQSQVEKHQKDYYLAEQLRAIQRELGRDDLTEELDQIKKKAKRLKLPKEAMDKLDGEIRRLEQMQPTSPEASVSRNYIDWLVSIPWSKQSKDSVSLKQTQAILDKSHAAMKKIKERILEFIATRKFAGDALKHSPIICLAGPPGVGKTSLAKSIAESLGREFVRITLGGMRDEAEIRGHRRTYIGAMPGKIIQAMKKASTTNPVMLLDEIDKMSMDFRGDPASALLEVLDSEHNNTFADYFLEVEYDLSKVIFITTANVVDNIPYPLLDRMEIINLSGYVLDEKIDIARNFLVPKLYKEHGLKAGQVRLDDAILKKIIEEYTKEAGVRNLERVLAKVLRKSIQLLLEKDEPKGVVITPERVEQWLGYPRYKKPDAKHEELVGLATGLAWTEVGGDILEVEVSVMKGKGSLSLTGQLGEVMQESAQAALTYVRSRAKEFGLKEDFYSDVDIHIHVPEGAIPKDGPSAGITMTSALVSALTKTSIQKRVAMTGEVTLRGRVLPVGGLKEKLLAAIRHGITKAIVPKENREEIREFETELGTDLTIIYADHMDTVIAEAFVEFPFKSTKGLVKTTKVAPKVAAKSGAKRKPARRATR